MKNTNRFRQHRGRWSSAPLLALLTGPLVALPVFADRYEAVDPGVDAAPAGINNQGTIVGSGWILTAATAFNEDGGVVGTGRMALTVDFSERGPFTFIM